MLFRQLVRPRDVRVLRDDVPRLDATVAHSFFPSFGWDGDVTASHFPAR